MKINKRVICQTVMRAFLTAFLLLIIFSDSSGQKNEGDVPQLKERLFYGGSFGLQFGTITDIQASPVIGIWILPRVGIAAGPNYRFYKYRTSKTHIYGGRSYLQYLFIRDLNSVIPLGINTGMFLHGEYELLSLESSYWKNPYTTGRFTTGTLLAGGGLSQQIGRRSFMNFMILWPLNDSGYGIYSNPEIRFAFIF